MGSGQDYRSHCHLLTIQEKHLSPTGVIQSSPLGSEREGTVLASKIQAKSTKKAISSAISHSGSPESLLLCDLDLEAVLIPMLAFNLPQ